MGLILRESEAYQVHHLPIVKAYADKTGQVEVINQIVPTEMAVQRDIIPQFNLALPAERSPVWLALAGLSCYGKLRMCRRWLWT